MRRMSTKYTSPLGCLGCLGLIVGFIPFLHYVDYYGKREKRTDACAFRRGQLLWVEDAYKRNHKGHSTVNLHELYASNTKTKDFPEMYACPEGGTYRILRVGKAIEIHCSYKNHLPVTYPNSTN